MTRDPGQPPRRMRQIGLFHSALDMQVSRYSLQCTADHFQGAGFDLEHPHNALAKAARHESSHCRGPR